MIFLTLENPRAGCKKRTSLFRVTKALSHYNSTEYTENILIKKYGLPELLLHAFNHRYRASVTGLETLVIDVLSVLRYNYSNVAGMNYLWLR